MFHYGEIAKLLVQYIASWFLFMLKLSLEFFSLTDPCINTELKHLKFKVVV